MKINPKNERLKRRYFCYLKEARRLDAQSVDAIAKALDRFEDHIKRRDFGQFRQEQAIAFKRSLAAQTSVRTGKKLAKGTVYSTLTALKDFFHWLAGQPGYRSKLTYSDAQFFNVSLKDLAVAKASRDDRFPTLDQIRMTLGAMPNCTPVDRRNRALVAFAILTGARDGAIASTRLRHVDIVERELVQDGSDMETKFAKTFRTFFFPVGEDIESIVRDWVEELRDKEGFQADDPLFPPIKVGIGQDGNFTPLGFSRVCWADAGPIRAIFKEAFKNAGLPSYNPHSFRKTVTRIGLDLGLDAAALKAWSQNLGHDGVLTTLKSYGELPAHRQKERTHPVKAAEER